MFSKLAVIIIGGTVTLVALVLFLDTPEERPLAVSSVYSSYFIDSSNNLALLTKSTPKDTETTIELPPITEESILPTSTPPSGTVTPIQNTDTPSPSPTNSPTISPLVANTATPLPTKVSSPTPATPNSPLPLFIKINSNLTTFSVAQKETATISIETAPLSLCSIKVVLPSGSVSSAKGLEDKKSDDTGLVSWSWNINWNTKPGTANIDIICNQEDRIAEKRISIEIVKS